MSSLKSSSSSEKDDENGEGWVDSETETESTRSRSPNDNINKYRMHSKKGINISFKKDLIELNDSFNTKIINLSQDINQKINNNFENFNKWASELTQSFNTINQLLNNKGLNNEIINSKEKNEININNSVNKNNNNNNPNHDHEMQDLNKDIPDLNNKPSLQVPTTSKRPADVGIETLIEVPAKKPIKQVKFKKMRLNPDDPQDNRFKILSVDSDDEDDTALSFPTINKEVIVKNKNKNNIQNKKNEVQTGKVSGKPVINSNQNIQPKPNQTNIKDKMPPIVVYNLNQKIFRNTLKDFNSLDYRVTHGANANRNIIKTNDAETYNNIRTVLNRNNSKYFTFTDKNDRGFNLLIKYVPCDFDKEDILQEFNELNLSEYVDKIVPLQENNKERLNYYILKLKPGSSIKTFENVKRLFNASVVIEKFNRTDLVQCFRCQRPGHVSFNCSMIPRCVKCSLSHPKGECLIVTNNNNRNELLCALCKTKGHPANYRGCPVLRKLLEEKIKSKSIERNNKLLEHKKFVSESAARKVVPEFTFASVARAHKEIPVPNTENNAMLDLLNLESYEFFGCDYKTLDEKFMKYMNTINTASSGEARKMALLSFIMDVRHNG